MGYNGCQGDDLVRLFDFGLSRKLRPVNEISPRMQQYEGFCGTRDLASLNAMNNLEQGRKDDIGKNSFFF